MTLQEIKTQAETLCDADKGQLATELLTMMAPPDYWVTDEEVAERVREIETGEKQDISFGELKQRLGK